MSVIILTGSAASGKNTIAHLFTQKRKQCADIDVDLIRWMYRKPHKAPWEGEEGMRQLKFGAKNACLLAKRFIENNIDVIITDVITDETAKIYRELLSEVKIVLLMPTFEEAHTRFINRSHTITENEFKWVYELEQKLTIYDEKIDNTNISAQDLAERLNSMF